MPRRNLALYSLLILAAVTLPVLLDLAPLTRADLFDSPIPTYDFLPLVQNDAFESPLPPPSTFLYLPLAVRTW